MVTHGIIPTHHELLALFDADFNNGHLYWRVKSARTAVGQEAGHCTVFGGKKYWSVKVWQKAYLRGAILFCMKHGYYAKPVLDHINRNSLDDRIDNLRAATHVQNLWNSNPHRRTLKLPRGVSPSRTKDRYCAKINCNLRHYYLGTFSTVEDASAAYEAKRRELFGEFA